MLVGAYATCYALINIDSALVLVNISGFRAQHAILDPILALLRAVGFKQSPLLAMGGEPNSKLF